MFLFLECEREAQEVNIVHHLFADRLDFVLLRLPNMLDCSGCNQSSVHISAKRVQRGGRNFATERS